MAGPSDGAQFFGSAQAGWDMVTNQMAQIAVGNTLRALSNPQAAPPMPGQGMPQQGMPPGGQPPPGAAPMQGQPPAGPPMSGGPGMGAPPMGGMPPQGPPMGQPRPPMGGPPMGGQPPPQMQPGAGPASQGQMPPQQGQQQPQLNWQVILQKVRQANPGAPPNVLAAAVDKFIPLMNSQSQMEWKNYIQPQIAQLHAQVQERGQDVTARGQDIRADTAAGAQATTQRGQDIRADTAERGQDIRAQTATDNRISRETIAAAGRDGRMAMFEAGLISKQDMDAANRAERGRETDERVGATERGQDIRSNTATEAEGGRMTRAEQARTSREKIAGEQETGRNIRAEGAIESREGIAGRAEAGKNIRQEGQIESRESIAGANRGEKAKESEERLEAGKDVLKSRIQLATDRINTERARFGLPPVGEKEGAQIEAQTGEHSPARSDGDRIADQIVAGKRPPQTTGLGMSGGFMVSGSLARRYPEFDQTRATLEYEAARRTVMGLTSPQQVRFQQLGHAVINTFDKVIDDAKKMKLSGVSPLNKADIDYLVNYRGNTPAGKLAARYLQDVSFLKGEVANLENGGYAPTESSWEQAKNVINENYGVDEMLGTAVNAQRLINYRLNALTELPGGTMGVGGGAQNRYLPPGAPQGGSQGGGNVIKYDAQGNRIGQ